MGSVNGDDDEPNIVSSVFSLVRYNNPVVIEKNDDASKSSTPKPPKPSSKSAADDEPTRRPKSSGEGSEASASLAAKQRSETEEILDSILPPREWEENGQLWRQSVSCTPATRLDVINLQVMLLRPLPLLLLGPPFFRLFFLGPPPC
jgi:dynein light intermediate chain